MTGSILRRSPHRFPLALALVQLLLAACAGGPDDRPAGSTDRSGPAARAEAAGGADAPVCLHGEPWVGDGPVPLPDAGPGDAVEVAGLRWQAHPGCERFVIDLATDAAAPATSPGRVSAEVLRDLGVVRVSLPDVERAGPDATEAALDGTLARAAYAVRSGEGYWVYVDLHLADAAEARVGVLAEPARVVVDLRPGGGPVPPPPATGHLVVVLDPRPGEATYPLTVAGYARTFESNVVLRLVQGGEDVYETFTTATGWVDSWGYYSFTVGDGPTGPVEVHVGDHSARDGTWEGATVELRMR